MKRQCCMYITTLERTHREENEDADKNHHRVQFFAALIKHKEQSNYQVFTT